MPTTNAQQMHSTRQNVLKQIKQQSALAEQILGEGISEHLRNSANEATPHCHTSLSPQRGIQQMGTIAQKLILPWDYTVTSNLLWFLLSTMQHFLHGCVVIFLITNAEAIMRFFLHYFPVILNDILIARYLALFLPHLIYIKNLIIILCNELTLHLIYVSAEMPIYSKNNNDNMARKSLYTSKSHTVNLRAQKC